MLEIHGTEDHTRCRPCRGIVRWLPPQVLCHFLLGLRACVDRVLESSGESKRPNAVDVLRCHHLWEPRQTLSPSNIEDVGSVEYMNALVEPVSFLIMLSCGQKVLTPACMILRVAVMPFHLAKRSHQGIAFFLLLSSRPPNRHVSNQAR